MGGKRKRASHRSKKAGEHKAGVRPYMGKPYGIGTSHQTHRSFRHTEFGVPPEPEVTPLYKLIKRIFGR